MAAKKDKNLVITIIPDEIIGADISRSRDYKYASVGVKVNDNEYLRVSYEWKGDGIPDFVMSLMGWMQSNKEELAKIKEEHVEEYEKLNSRTSVRDIIQLAKSNVKMDPKLDKVISAVRAYVKDVDKI